MVFNRMWTSDSRFCRPSNGGNTSGKRKIAWIDRLIWRKLVWFAHCPLGATTFKTPLKKGVFYFLTGFPIPADAKAFQYEAYLSYEGHYTLDNPEHRHTSDRIGRHSPGPFGQRHLYAAGELACLSRQGEQGGNEEQLA